MHEQGTSVSPQQKNVIAQVLSRAGELGAADMPRGHYVSPRRCPNAHAARCEKEFRTHACEKRTHDRCGTSGTRWRLHPISGPFAGAVGGEDVLVEYFRGRGGGMGGQGALRGSQEGAGGGMRGRRDAPDGRAALRCGEGLGRRSRMRGRALVRRRHSLR
ncbi:hypothetical protein DENSPDRAFT_623985 [Dentipellis sp. KUC8613]|nr:hypothetical protein DENSPDRAFT_623985 [Dentipellis sp. KUC8613]